MSIQWGRILLGAFLMELILFAIAVPLNLLGASRVELYSLPPAAFIATFGVTMWLGKKFISRPVLHGVLIGVAGTLMYVGLSLAAPEPWQYVLGNALKVAGGAVGGMVLARRHARTGGPLEPLLLSSLRRRGKATAE